MQLMNLRCKNERNKEDFAPRGLPNVDPLSAGHADEPLEIHKANDHTLLLHSGGQQNILSKTLDALYSRGYINICI